MKYDEEMKRVTDSHKEDMKRLFERVTSVMDEGLILVFIFA